MNNKRILICALLLGSIQTWTVEEESLSLPIEPLKVGNFANVLWSSNSFGFGEFLFNKGTIAPYFTIFHTKGDNQNSTTLFLQTGYGITNIVSLLVNLPIITNVSSNGFTTQGVGDLTTQFEYAFYQKSSESFFNQATIVANITFPTGHLSLTNRPSTGLGAISLFFGGTLSHTSENWYAYLSDGISVTTPHKNIQVGSTVLYEGGIGRNLGNPGGTTLTAVLEFNGVYTQKTKTHCTYNQNSGGNTIFLGPTICWSIKNAQLFGGVQFPAYQHLNGTQGKQKFRLIFNAIAAF